ncbi:MAG: DUF484 family protein [Wenzhouxiangellaceae bacterium]
MNECSIDHKTIREWLRAHPDFLRNQPELLAELEIPHQTGTGARSLIEHQVETLRRQKQELNDQLTRLAQIAEQNEQRLRRVHRLTLQLATAATVPAVIEALSAELGSNFGADTVALLLQGSLPDQAPAAAGLRPLPSPLPDWLNELLERGEPVCGRLTQAKRELLFGAQAAAETRSAAVVPLARIGVLAIGAASPDRFQPDMGTLFLGLLGEALTFRLTLDSSDELADSRASA